MEGWPSQAMATSAGAAGLTKLKSSSALASDPAADPRSRKIAASPRLRWPDQQLSSPRGLFGSVPTIAPRDPCPRSGHRWQAVS